MMKKCIKLIFDRALVTSTQIPMLFTQPQEFFFLFNLLIINFRKIISSLIYFYSHYQSLCIKSSCHSNVIFINITYRQDKLTRMRWHLEQSIRDVKSDYDLSKINSRMIYLSFIYHRMLLHLETYSNHKICRKDEKLFFITKDWKLFVSLIKIDFHISFGIYQTHFLQSIILRLDTKTEWKWMNKDNLNRY